MTEAEISAKCAEVWSGMKHSANAMLRVWRAETKRRRKGTERRKHLPHHTLCRLEALR